jgi:hypothetical protein
MKSNPTSQIGSEENKQRLVAQARALHDEVLEAIYHLEIALASAAPRREKVWNKRVIEELGKVSDLLDEHARSAEADEGLFSTIVTAQPRLAHHVDRLGREQNNLLEQSRSLERQFAHHGEGALPNFRDVRKGIRSLLNALSSHRADVNDLVFEAFSTDIGIGD